MEICRKREKAVKSCGKRVYKVNNKKEINKVMQTKRNKEMWNKKIKIGEIYKEIDSNKEVGDKEREREGINKNKNRKQKTEVGDDEKRKKG